MKKMLIITFALLFVGCEVLCTLDFDTIQHDGICRSTHDQQGGVILLEDTDECGPSDNTEGD